MSGEGKATMTARVLTCVYCGQEYPQGTPAWGNKVLTDHIRECRKHPLRQTEQERDEAVGLLHETYHVLSSYEHTCQAECDLEDRLGNWLAAHDKEEGPISVGGLAAELREENGDGEQGI